jgi:NAD(P)H-flavin reductase
MEIQFRKPSMRYKAGQWLFLQVPDVSSQQWHPFTITSCPFDPYISVHIRQVGDFTKALGDALGCGPAQEKEFDGLDQGGVFVIDLANGQTMPKLRIDGPYGANRRVDWHRDRCHTMGVSSEEHLQHTSPRKCSKTVAKSRVHLDMQGHILL